MKFDKHGIVDLYAPRHLYKYQPINEYSLINLKNKILWASNPLAFNDPFEFKYNQIGNNPQKTQVDQFLDKIKESRVICLTEDPLNILMWSHYANSHKGFCMGFYNSNLTYAVHYSDEFISVDFSLNTERQRIIDIHKILHTKSKVWEYEKERRMTFISEVSPAVQYPGELFMIAFGINTDIEDIRKIRSIVNDENVRFYQCEFVQGHFKLDFKNAPN